MNQIVPRMLPVCRQGCFRKLLSIPSIPRLLRTSSTIYLKGSNCFYHQNSWTDFKEFLSISVIQHRHTSFDSRSIRRRTDEHFDSDDQKNFRKLYHFPNTRGLRFLQHGKILTVAMTAFVVLLEKNSSPLMLMLSVALTGGIWFLASSALKSVCRLYVNDSTEIIKIAYMDNLGRRRDLFCKLSDIQAVKGPTKSDPNALRLELAIKNSNKQYWLLLKYCSKREIRELNEYFPLKRKI